MDEHVASAKRKSIGEDESTFHKRSRNDSQEDFLRRICGGGGANEHVDDRHDGSEEDPDEEEEVDEDDEVDHYALEFEREDEEFNSNGFASAVVESDVDTDDDEEDRADKHMGDIEEKEEEEEDDCGVENEHVAAHLHRIDQLSKSFMVVRGLTSHQMESYEHFLQFSLPSIIEGAPMRINCVKQHAYHVISFVNTKLRRPTIRESSGQLRFILPREAHVRKQTYSADILVDIAHKVYASSSEAPTHFKLMENKLYQNVLYGRVPAMLSSSVCNDRHRIHAPYKNMTGLFIVNGYSKVLVSQERLKNNTAYVHIPKTVKNGRQLMRCEIRSIHHNKIRSTSTLNILLSSVKQSLPEITVMIPFIKFPVPLVIVFRLMGVHDLSMIVSLIVGTTSRKQEQQTYKLHHVVTNLIYAEDDQSGTANMSQEELFDWLGKQGGTERNKRKRIADVRHIVHNELLPHTGDDFSDTEAEAITNFNKACHLAHAVRKLIRVFLAEIPPDDIDEQRNRNICSGGTLIGLLLRQLTRNMVKALHVQIFKAVKMARYINIGDFFSHRKITPGLNYAFSTGNWSAQRSSTNNQTGICQVYICFFFYFTEKKIQTKIQFLFHLRCVTKKKKIVYRCSTP